MKLMEPVYRTMESSITSLIADLIAVHGVPTSVGEADDLADLIFPLLLTERRTIWAREAGMIADDHPDLVIPEVPFYPATATRKMVRRAAGLAPGARGVQLELFDPKTVELYKTSVAPYTEPAAAEVVKAFTDRTAAGSARHVKSASRDLVTETARTNGVGWARRLQGGENCSFCALLASRGAVYSKETVRFRTHDHCDCTGDIVRDAGHWDGKEEADRLLELWESSDGMTDFDRRYKEMISDALPA